MTPADDGAGEGAVTTSTPHEIKTTVGHPDHFSNARGSGVAALIGFFQICGTGIVVYLAWWLNARADARALASPHLAWAYFLPAWMLLTLYLPTDPLTKTLARMGVAAGALGLAAGALALPMMAADPMRHAGETPPEMAAWNMAACAALALPVAWGLRSLAMTRLPERI